MKRYIGITWIILSFPLNVIGVLAAWLWIGLRVGWEMGWDFLEFVDKGMKR